VRVSEWFSTFLENRDAGFFSFPPSGSLRLLPGQADVHVPCRTRPPYLFSRLRSPPSSAPPRYTFFFSPPTFLAHHRFFSETASSLGWMHFPSPVRSASSLSPKLSAVSPSPRKLLCSDPLLWFSFRPPPITISPPEQIPYMPTL